MFILLNFYADIDFACLIFWVTNKTDIDRVQLTKISSLQNRPGSSKDINGVSPKHMVYLLSTPLDVAGGTQLKFTNSWFGLGRMKESTVTFCVSLGGGEVVLVSQKNWVSTAVDLAGKRTLDSINWKNS